MADQTVNQTPASDLSEQSQIRLDKLNKLIEAGKSPYILTKFDRSHLSDEIVAHYDELEGKTVSMAGRMVSRRVMGKASFAHLLDRNGRFQIYVRRDDVGEEAYKDFKDYDLGDVIGVTGVPFQDQDRRNLAARADADPADQGAAPAAREVPRSDRHRHAVSSALPRPDRQSRGAGHLRQAQHDHAGAARLPGRPRLSGGRDPHPDPL